MFNNYFKRNRLDITEPTEQQKTADKNAVFSRIGNDTAAPKPLALDAQSPKLVRGESKKRFPFAAVAGVAVAAAIALPIGISALNGITDKPADGVSADFVSPADSAASAAFSAAESTDSTAETSEPTDLVRPISPSDSAVYTDVDASECEDMFRAYFAEISVIQEEYDSTVPIPDFLGEYITPVGKTGEKDGITVTLYGVICYDENLYICYSYDVDKEKLPEEYAVKEHIYVQPDVYSSATYLNGWGGHGGSDYRVDGYDGVIMTQLLYSHPFTDENLYISFDLNGWCDDFETDTALPSYSTGLEFNIPLCEFENREANFAPSEEDSAHSGIVSANVTPFGCRVLFAHTTSEYTRERYLTGVIYMKDGTHVTSCGGCSNMSFINESFLISPIDPSEISYIVFTPNYGREIVLYPTE